MRDVDAVFPWISIRILIIAFFAASTGCATLPAIGPSAANISAEAATDLKPGAFILVDVTPELAVRFGDRRQPVQLLPDVASPAGQRLAPGDRIQITLFEPTGGGLLGGESGGAMRALPIQVVSADGRVRIPYAGAVNVTGVDAARAAERIEQALAGQAIEPQVIVTLMASPSSVATVLGDAVTRGAQVAIEGAGERLLNAIAQAGGFSQPLYETVVRLTRDGASQSVRADTLLATPTLNVPLRRGDIIAIERMPESFVVLGAVQAPAQVPFHQSRLRVSEALGRSGGLSSSLADPQGVFIVRYEASSMKPALKKAAAQIEGNWETEAAPVIYKFDLTTPNGLLAARRFDMLNGDILYVASAPITPVEQILRLAGLALAPVTSAAILGSL